MKWTQLLMPVVAGLIIGGLAVAILNLHLFATPADLAQAELRISQTYATKTELYQAIQDVKELLIEIKDSLQKGK